MSTSASAPPIGPVALRVYGWIAVALAALGTVQLLSQRAGSLTWVALVGALASAAAVALLPRATLWAVAVLAAAIATMVATIEVPVFASFVAVMIAAFTLARYGSLRTALAGYAVLVGTVVVVALPEFAANDEGAFAVIYPIFYFGGAGLLGWLARKRAELLASAVAHADALEREQHQQAELAASAERERLARDMHDVISHGVSLMVLQAEAAREVLHDRPDAAAVALDAIADAGRIAINDLHRMLGVLRGPSTDLKALAASVSAAGLTVDLRLSGPWEELDAATRAALFRVAQESLTNTMRHASGADQAVITVDCTPDLVTLEILDDGVTTTGFTGGSGSGLRGLGERVAAVGGTFDAGPRSDGPGFRVVASAPRSSS